MNKEEAERQAMRALRQSLIREHEAWATFKRYAWGAGISTVVAAAAAIYYLA